MKRATKLHRDAMDLAEKALNAQRAADRVLAQKLFEEAFQKERDAALLVAKTTDNEPTRSVLLRSAASLALNCGQSREAERLIALGLAGNPPEELRDELRELREDVRMAAEGRNEGIRVLEELDCQAILNPAVPQASPSRQGRNEGVRVIDELVVETEDTHETTERSGTA
jgi:hypothetical protein